MDTTTAAEKAKVSVRTIQRWCQRGIITAAKTAGRWVIESASLLRKITPKRSTMTRIEKHATDLGWTRTTQHRLHYRRRGFTHKVDYSHRGDAEFHAAVLEGTPETYDVARLSHPAQSLHNGYYWKLTSHDSSDSKPLDFRIDVDSPFSDSSEWQPVADRMIHAALQHAEGAPERRAQKSEGDAIASAESTVRQARQQQLAEREREAGPLATPRQVDYILTLLSERQRSGEGGGFYSGPTDRAGIEMMSRREASLYITSLKGDY